MTHDGLGHALSATFSPSTGNQCAPLDRICIISNHFSAKLAMLPPLHLAASSCDDPDEKQGIGPLCFQLPPQPVQDSCLCPTPNRLGLGTRWPSGIHWIWHHNLHTSPRQSPRPFYIPLRIERTPRTPPLPEEVFSFRLWVLSGTHKPYSGQERQ